MVIRIVPPGLFVYIYYTIEYAKSKAFKMQLPCSNPFSEDRTARPPESGHLLYILPVSRRLLDDILTKAAEDRRHLGVNRIALGIQLIVPDTVDEPLLLIEKKRTGGPGGPPPKH